MVVISASQLQTLRSLSFRHCCALSSHRLTSNAARPKKSFSSHKVHAEAAETSNNGPNQTESPLMAPNRAIAKDMLGFINDSWTQFHAVEEVSKMLHKAGFQKLVETAEWKLQAGGRYYFTRNLSTLVAFAVGSDFKLGGGFHLIGAHTDSPCLKLKPVSKGKKSGYLMASVEPYGGGLWHTWFDRDLSVAGRVIVRQGGKMVHRLVKVQRPIMRIPMLAIHLYREIYDAGFKPNKQEHLAPVLATALKAEVNKDGEMAVDDEQEKHHPLLLRILAAELEVAAEDIVDFELNVCDTQPGVIGGAQKEFIFVGRLDNLAMSYCAARALVDSFPDETSLQGQDAVKAVALFDHEEVGSASAQGAGGPVMKDAITRITSSFAGSAESAIARAVQGSFLVSADMAHALHPNYPEKHEPDHKPQFHKGLVIKHNANQRYATNAISATLFREVATRHGIPTQEFAVRSDMACGSTIGPILASGIGCRTVDVGAPQLSMHSIREMCSVDDISHSYTHFVAFFKEFSEVDKVLDVSEPNILGIISDTPCNNVH